MKTMMDDYGKLLLAPKASKESTLPINGSLTKNQIVVSDSYWYDGLWMADVVFADDIDQPRFSVVVGW